MVTREYECKSCGKRFEIRQSIKDDALSHCPECNGELRQIYGTKQDFYLFTSPGVGAISNRFATKGVGARRPWNLRKN